MASNGAIDYIVAFIGNFEGTGCLSCLWVAEIERKPFDCDSIWKSATTRYLSKANTLTYRIGMKNEADAC